MANINLNSFLKNNDNARLDFNDDYLKNFGVPKYIYCIRNKIRFYNKSCIFYITKDCLKFDCFFVKFGILLYNFYLVFNKYLNFIDFLNKHNIKVIKKDNYYDVIILDKKDTKIDVKKLLYKSNLIIKFGRMNKSK